MSTNTILASAPLTATGYHLKANGTTLGNSLIWDNGTNVGIGTSTPARKLTVVGTIAAILSDANDVQCALSATTTAVNIAATYGTTGSYLPLTFSTGSDERMRITSGGLVNILSDSTNTTFTSSGALAIKNAASEPFISWHSNTGTRLGFIQMQSAGTAYFSVQVAQALAFDTSGAEKMRITSGKDVLINTTAIRTSASGSNATLNIKGGIYFGDTNSESCTINNNDSFICNFDANNDGGTSNFFSIAKGRTGESGGTEFFRVTGGGYTKMSNDGTYVSSTGSFHEIKTTLTNNNPVYISNTASSNPYGAYIYFPNASPNDGTRYFFIFVFDSTATRFSALSNGGLANYATNNVVLSDERLKKDIIPLESVWDKIKILK